MRRFLLSLILLLAGGPGFAQMTAKAYDPAFELRQEIAQILTRSLHGQWAQIKAKNAGDAQALESSSETIRSDVQQIETRIHNYLKAIGADFRAAPEKESENAKEEIVFRFATDAPHASWINQIAYLLHQHGISFVIKPSMLIGREYGAYFPNEKSIALASLPFPESFAPPLRHEIYHFLIIEVAKRSNAAHFQRGRYTSAKTDGEEEYYRSFHFSELGAFAELLRDILTLTNYNEDSLTFTNHLLSGMRNRFLKFTETMLSSVDAAIEATHSQAFTKQTLKLVRHQNSPFVAFVFVDEAGNVFELDELFVTKELALNYDANLAVQRWEIKNLPQPIQSQIYFRLRQYRGLVKRFQQEILGIPEAAFLGRQQMIGYAGRPHLKLNELNIEWLTLLGIAPNDSSRKMEEQYRPLLKCAREICPSLPPDCAHLLK